MGYTKINDNLSVHQSLSDEPNIDDGLSSEELKKKFDEPAEKLKNAFNNLIDEMAMITSSQNIGANSLDIADTSEGNVQAKLIKIWEEMKNVTLGQIPDNSITKEKIETEYEKTLARKENLGPLYLASMFHEVNNENQKALDYVPPSLSSTNKQGYTITALTSNTTYNFGDKDIYTMLGGNGNDSIRGDYYSNAPHTRDGILIKFPILLKATSVFVKGSNLSIEVYGSNDGENFTEIYKTSERAANGTYNFENKNYYEYYKIVIANWNTGTGFLYNNVKFFGKYINKENAVVTTPTLSVSNKQGYTVTPIGTVTYNGVEDIYTMLGGSGDTSISISSGAGLLIEFPKYFKMNEYRLCGAENLTIAIYGSNDGENFTHVHTTGSFNSGHNHNFKSISNTNYYKFYKIISNKASGNYALYSDMFFKGEVLDLLQGNKLSIDKKYTNEELEDYQKGMIVKIITPVDYLEGENLESTLNVYETRDVEIPKNLFSNSYYSLVYNGEKFVHESEVQNG